MINKTHDLAYYEYLYVDAIKPGIAKGNEYVMDACAWIADRWMDDESFVPWMDNSEELLLELEQLDQKLYAVVVDGMTILKRLVDDYQPSIGDTIESLKKAHKELLSEQVDGVEHLIQEIEEEIDRLERIECSASEVRYRTIKKAFESLSKTTV